MNQRSGFPTIVQYFFGILHFLVPVVGISLNLYVLKKLRSIAKLNVFRFETSSALPLWAMSICDSICLMAQFAQASFHVFVKFRGDRITAKNAQTAALFCKIDLYLIHSSTAFSVWCWLVLSVLRYIAVFHPFKYRTIWRQPRDALVVLASLSCILELWIPILVSYNPQYLSCYENTDVNSAMSQTAHMLDILLSYVVPAFIRILLDGIVLCYCYRPNVVEIPVMERRCAISAPSGLPAAAELTEKSPMSIILSLTRQPILYRRPEVCKRKHSMIKRSLIISAVNLCCNLPSHALRALWTLDGGEQLIPEKYLLVLEGISQLLYFGQFTCNAFYLSTTIYETSTIPMRPCVIRPNASAGNVLRTPSGKQRIAEDIEELI
ncbi:7 transmembrane receptor (rhodopsin family) domain-containing protein [Ditylenchus destructor]|uniref:7 transmembrane receptor (Rhodopsin family) domain-containing protein n=1 Tax=Ditylenchus destructor TaxID=166010 RepID=A0AAD4NF80_9BILA|nr:7 transmembrane receptor (rhodopsin family) domain-containing protein [Ditylenchus destructor]